MTIEERLTKAGLPYLGCTNGNHKFTRALTAQEEEQVALLIDESRENDRLQEIKTKAGEIILARFPIWKQHNLHMRFTELVDKALAGEELTAEEQAEKAASKVSWAWVKAVRTESDRLERIAGATSRDGNWPA